MLKAAATEQKPGLVVLQRNGIFSPFCLSFRVVQQKKHATMEGEQENPLFIEDLLSMKNLKTLEMKATGGWDGRLR